jgi:hypothetical protein
MSSPLFNNFGIIISLVILISLSVLCHLQNWITPSNSEVLINKSKNSTPVEKLNNAAKLKELKENYQTIRDYASFQCNKKNCRNDLCEVIHAELPDELLRSCGTGPEDKPKLTAEQLRIFLLYNYLKAGKYALLHKIETQGGKL